MRKDKKLTFKDAQRVSETYFLKTGLSVVGVTLLFLALNNILISIGIYKALVAFLTMCPCVLANFFITKKFTKEYKQELNSIIEQIIKYYKQDAENMKEELQKKYEKEKDENEIKKDYPKDSIIYIDSDITKTNEKELVDQLTYCVGQKDDFFDKDKRNEILNIKVKHMGKN